jgi:hypothetical protein
MVVLCQRHVPKIHRLSVAALEGQGFVRRSYIKVLVKPYVWMTGYSRLHLYSFTVIQVCSPAHVDRDR